MTPDSDPLRIAYREILHIWGAIPLYVWALTALWLVQRRLPRLRDRIIVAVVILMGVVLNEIHDLALGGSWGKSAWDLGVWAFVLTGMTAGTWWWERRREG